MEPITSSIGGVFGDFDAVTFDDGLRASGNILYKVPYCE